jgi:hypothetical protein
MSPSLRGSVDDWTTSGIHSPRVAMLTWLVMNGPSAVFKGQKTRGARGAECLPR